MQENIIYKKEIDKIIIELNCNEDKKLKSKDLDQLSWLVTLKSFT